MAAPITSIKRTERSELEIQQDKLAELQKQIAEQEESLQKIMEITGELHKIGALDALQAMLHSKRKDYRHSVRSSIQRTCYQPAQ